MTHHHDFTRHRWGHMIEYQWVDAPVLPNGDILVQGCTTPLPVPEDTLEIGPSGFPKLNEARFKFIKVEPFENPPDGFFAVIRKLEEEE